MTKEQETALREVHERWEIETDFDTFKATARPLLGGGGCLMVHVGSPSNPMWLGIETDGYTHS